MMKSSVDYTGHDILDSLEDVKNFNHCMFRSVEPYLGSRILEVGSGTGNLSCFLPIREKLYLSDLDQSYVERLTFEFKGEPKVKVSPLDISSCQIKSDWCDPDYPDTILCLNVLEHIEDDLSALENMKSLLDEKSKNAKLIILVPQFMSLFGSYDEIVGHYRRYSKSELISKMESVGFQIDSVFDFNSLSIPGWWFNAKLMKAGQMPKWQLKIFDKIFPASYYLEKKFQLPGLSLIAVGSIKNP